jgi:hypothetical protein
MTSYIYIYNAEFVLEWEMFQTKVGVRIKKHFVFNDSFKKILSFMRKCE